MATKQCYIRMDEELVKKLDHMAIDAGMSRQLLVGNMLQYCVDNNVTMPSPSKPKSKKKKGI